MGFPSGTTGQEPTWPMQETEETTASSLGQEDPLKEDMATHSSPWRVPRTVELGRL